MNAQVHGTRRKLGYMLPAALLLLILAPAPASAQEFVGRVIASVGRVTATDADGNDRPLTSNDVVYAGERITTGPEGRVHVRFRDDGLVDLKPGTEFEIEQFRERTAERAGSAVFNFFKGALRTITGAIGLGDDAYSMNTPVATIGVRGTEYALQFCESDCADGIPPGLYGRVTKDGVTVDNQHGRGSFGAGQYFLVPPEDEPRLLLTPPPGILDGVDDGETVDRAAEIRERLAALPAGIRRDALRLIRAYLQSSGTFDLALLESEFEAANFSVDSSDGLTLTGGATPDCCLAFGSVGSTGGTTFPIGFTSVIPVVGQGSNQTFTLDANGIPLTIAFQDTNTGETIAFDYTRTSVQQTGSTSGVDWGLLTGPWDFITDDGSQVITTSLDAGALAFARFTDLTTPTQLGTLSGTSTYSPVGGPNAADSLGNLWTVSQLDIGVDFTSQTADLLALQLDEGATGSGSVALVSPTPITFNPDVGGIGAVFNENPVAISYSYGQVTSGSGEVDVVGIFTTSDGSVLPVSFNASLTDSFTGLPVLEVTGVQVLQEVVQP